MSWRLIIIILGFAAAGFYGAAQAADEVTAGNQEGWAIRAASDFPDPARSMPGGVWVGIRS